MWCLQITQSPKPEYENFCLENAEKIPKIKKKKKKANLHNSLTARKLSLLQHTYISNTTVKM